MLGGWRLGSREEEGEGEQLHEPRDTDSKKQRTQAHPNPWNILAATC